MVKHVAFIGLRYPEQDCVKAAVAVAEWKFPDTKNRDRKSSQFGAEWLSNDPTKPFIWAHITLARRELIETLELESVAYTDAHPPGDAFFKYLSLNDSKQLQNSKI